MLFRNLYFVVIIVLLNLLSACASGESEADDSWMLDKIHLSIQMVEYYLYI